MGRRRLSHGKGRIGSMKTPDKAEVPRRDRGSLWPLQPAAACDHRTFLAKSHGSRDAGIRGQKADTEWLLRQFAEIKAEGSLSRCSGYKNRACVTETQGTIS